MSLIKSTAEFFRKHLPGHLNVQVYSLSADRDEMVVVVTTQVGMAMTITGREAYSEHGLDARIDHLLLTLKSVDCTRAPPPPVELEGPDPHHNED